MKFKELEPQESMVPFLKLTDKASVRGVFRGDPADFRKHWIDGRTVQCRGRETCPHCKAGERASFRFRLNFVTKEGETYVAKVFEAGRQVYEDLSELAKDYDLPNHLVKISRTGTGTDTRYAIMPVPKGELSKDQQKAIGAVPLVALSPENGAQPQQGEQQDANEDMPF